MAGPPYLGRVRTSVEGQPSLTLPFGIGAHCMKYKPRHPVVNLIGAIGCCAVGLVLIVCGIGDLDHPRFGISAYDFLRFSSEYGIYWGSLRTTLGGIGIWYHIRYLRQRKQRKMVKESKIAEHVAGPNDEERG